MTTSSSTNNQPEAIQKPGVDNPKIIDNLRLESASNEVILTMIEPRPWPTEDKYIRGRLIQLQNKVDSYASYVADGFLKQQYPQYADKLVKIVLECADKPTGEFAHFMEVASEFLETVQINFEYEVVSEQRVQSFFSFLDKQ